MTGKRNKSTKHMKHEAKKENNDSRPEGIPKTMTTTPAPVSGGGNMNKMAAPRDGWEFWEGDAWTPTPSTAFKLLMSARLCAALWTGISDCDETFNYWEPAHFLYRGKGFQTWEYSPVYAIRSYAYILLHVLPMKLISIFVSDNSILMFFLVRCLLGLACAVSEMVLYRGVCVALGPSPGRLTLVMLIFSSGMFVSSTAFIPSSFSMYLTMTAVGAWFMGCLHIAILSVAASAIVGWPFAGVLGIGIAIDVVILQRRLDYFLKWGVIGLAVFLIPLVVVDDFYYGKFVVAPLNIVLYNIFSGHGPELYGVEPLSFYFINGFLNLNLAFLLALVSLPFLMISSYVLKHKFKKVLLTMLTLCPIYVWVLIFFSRPHKEERFLFPIYPLIIVAASMVLDHIQRLLQLMVRKTLGGKTVSVPSWPGAVFCLAFIILSVSRIVALHTGYHAPMDVYVELHRLGREDPGFQSLPKELPVNVCVGKEWYRYTSSFFLPGSNWNLKLLQSEFKGQLPKPYDASDPFPTRLIPSHMNDLNREEPSRYTPISHCHFLIDRDSESGTRLEPRYSHQPNWTVVHSTPFLDAARSHRLYRAFYIPVLSSQHCVYTNYTLLKNTARVEKLLRRASRSSST